MIEHKADCAEGRERFADLMMIQPGAEVFRPFIEQFRDIYANKDTGQPIEAGKMEKDDPDFRMELAKELDYYEMIYMDPRLYEKADKHDMVLYGVRPGTIKGPNCLAFALKMPVKTDGQLLDIKPYPGYYAGLRWSEKLMDAIACGDKIEYVKQEMAKRVGEDVKAIGGELVEVSKDYQCADGEWKICMMASSKLEDFHFMREGDHAWFHKEGALRVSCFDKDYKLITDPEHCKTDYEQFLGYYVIRNAVGKES